MMIRFNKYEKFDEMRIEIGLRADRSQGMPHHKTSLRSLHSLIGKNRVFNYSFDRNRSSFSMKQLSIVKSSFSMNKYKSQWKTHGKYLMREKARGEELGFNEKEKGVDIPKVLDSWQKAKDEKVYKFIVSPEQGERMDMTAHTRKLMKQLEKDLNREIHWTAIVHINTKHKHAHIVVRTVDKNDLTFDLSNDYRKKGMRVRSQQIATQELGYRQRKDILLARQKSIQLNHITSIDRDIQRGKNKNNEIYINLEKTTAYGYSKGLQTLRRLKHLENKELAKKIGINEYRVKVDFLQTLKNEQIKHDIIKSLYACRKNMLDKELPLKYIINLDKKQKVIGTIAGVGVSGEAENTRYVILEGVDGKAYRLDLKGKMLKERDQLKMKNGDLVYVEGKKFVKEGKEISYIYFRNFKTMDDLKKIKEITEIDLYFISKYRTDRKSLDIEKNTPKLKKAFGEMMIKRIDELVKAKKLDKKLNIVKTFERKREPERNLELGK